MRPRMRAAVIAVSFAVALSACSRSDQPAGKGKGAGPARTVRVATAQTRPMERVLPVAGTLAANEQAVLSVKIPGRVARLEVDLGSAVRRDQVVIEIDVGEILEDDVGAATCRQLRELFHVAGVLVVEHVMRALPTDHLKTL